MNINMKLSKMFGTAVFTLLSVVPTMAQTTMDDMLYLTVNENVTTVITASEPVRFVDISTDKVAGDQPINNTVRLKPNCHYRYGALPYPVCSYLYFPYG